MRRYVLIALMFIPAIAAWFLFQGLKDEGRRQIRRAGDGGIRATKKNAQDALNGFEGKGTFYQHQARVTLESRDISYTRAFYFLESWKRDESDAFLIDGLTVVQNPRPSKLKDLESFLVISNAEASATRVKKLKGALATFNSLTAKKARAAGGKNVTDANEFVLSEGVAANIPNKVKELPAYRVETDRANVLLNEGDLSTLLMPGEFVITTPDYTISGLGMEAKNEDSRLYIEKNPIIQSVATEDAPGGSRSLTGKGPLVWLPDDTIPGEARSILNRARFDFGHLTVHGDVVVNLAEMTIQGEELNARIGGENRKSNPGRLDSFRLSRNVVIKTERGEVRGDEARVDLDPDGHVTVWLEGEIVEVDWVEVTQKKSPAGRSLYASSRGALQIEVPALAERKSEPLIITMTDSVELDLRDEKKPLNFKGENLVVKLMQLTAINPETDEETQVWRFDNAVLRGNVDGDGADFHVESPKLTVTREYESTGALRREILAVDGPALLRRKGGLGRTLRGANVNTTMTAKRRITYWMPASPFAESRALAVGHVTAKESGAPDQNRVLNAEWLELVLLPAKNEGDRTKSLEATGSVDFTDEKGSQVLGDRVWVNRPAGRAEVEGKPARLTFVDNKKQKQNLRAPKIQFLADDARLVASGGFEGKLFLRGAVLTSDKNDPKKTQKTNTPWDVSGRDLVAIFGGRMPLTTRQEAAKDPVVLHEITLRERVRVESAEQLFTGDNLHYDFRSENGTMTGKPAKLISYRDADGVQLKDWVEANKIMTQTEWTLFEGNCRAQMNVKRQKRTRRDPSSWEAVRVDCSKDILIRKDMAIFTGRCLFERGVVATGGLRLESDKVVAHFVPTEGKRRRPQKLKRLEAYGNVNIARDELRGQGEVLNFDYIEKKAVLSAEGSNCRMWKTSGGVSSQGRVVEYDLDRKRITILKVSGSVSDKKESR